MPSAKAWIHALTKDELIEVLKRHRVEASGSINELRKRLKTFAERNPDYFSDKSTEPEKTQTASMTDNTPNASPPQLGETMNLVRKWDASPEKSHSRF